MRNFLYVILMLIIGSASSFFLYKTFIVPTVNGSISKTDESRKVDLISDKNVDRIQSSNVQINKVISDNINKSYNSIPKYRFEVICQKVDDSFMQAVKMGTQKAAEELNVFVKFNTVEFDNPADEPRCIDMAIAAKVDGIVTHIHNDMLMSPIIDKAFGRNIPVVTIETDARRSKRTTFVGTNSYNLGTKWGKLIVKAKGERAVVAVISNSPAYSNIPDSSENLMLTGIRDAVSAYPNIKIIPLRSDMGGIFSAEAAAMKIINQLKVVDTIVCTTEKQTVGVVQTMLEMNKVGYTIIGYDDSPEIKNYIEKGIIYGTVVSDPEKMGYESIKALVDIKNNRRVSNYITTDVKVVLKHE